MTSRATIVIDHFHGARILHGPARIQWTITHRQCWPHVGITEDMTPAQARSRAVSFWSNVDSMVRWFTSRPDWWARPDMDETVDYLAEMAGLYGQGAHRSD